LLFFKEKGEKMGKRIKKIILMICIFSLVMNQFQGISIDVSVAEEEPLLAFPGAEGGGKYTRGARAGRPITVYHVTNLNESGPGSLADAVSKPNRIIVFDVGGTIKLKKTLSIPSSNLTILGQTAPGDGITITGAGVELKSGISEIIIRYLRIRPGDEDGVSEHDGIGGRWVKNVILDHISVSWTVDEGITLYAGSMENVNNGIVTRKETSSNVTVQNCIGAESLRMSSHFKGAHGYGGIWGANNSSWYQNLLAHHDSRVPRLDRNLNKTDIRNNVFYNWGFNSTYGGEGTSTNGYIIQPSLVNLVNNYYKSGPSTYKNQYRILEISESNVSATGENGHTRTAAEIEQGKIDAKSRFYVNGNYMYGSSEVTANNWHSAPGYGVDNEEYGIRESKPFDMAEYSLPEQSAEEAYINVLNNAGATLPRRDSIDARIVAETKNRTGRIIDKVYEVGGFINTDANPENNARVFTIPEEWKIANNMGNSAETDIVPSGVWKGYTWIEAYVNDWTAQQESPTNPVVTVHSPKISTMNTNEQWLVVNQGEPILYHATTEQVGNYPINKMELYDGDVLVKTYENQDYINEDISSLITTAGTHYITSRAYNTRGESTTSSTSIVYVKPKGYLKDNWQYTQIGITPYDKKGGAVYNESTNQYILSGSGSIGGKSDNFDYMYQMISGDFEFIAKIDSIPKYENEVRSGIMLRESLTSNSKFIMISDNWKKYGENIEILSRTQTGGSMTSAFFKNSSGTEVKNTGGSSDNYDIPKWMKLKREGDKITLSVSNSGTDWTDNARQPYTLTTTINTNNVYIGLAVDSNSGTGGKNYFTMSKFSNLKLISDNKAPVIQPDPDAVIQHDVVLNVDPVANSAWFKAIKSVTIDGTTTTAYQIDSSSGIITLNGSNFPNVKTYTIRIQAFNYSDVIIYQDVGESQVIKPIANPPAGAVEAGTQVSLSTRTNDAIIYYTTDGSTPTTDSQVYSSPITVDKSMVINAIAVKPGLRDSEMLTAFYGIVETQKIYEDFSGWGSSYPDNWTGSVFNTYVSIVKDENYTGGAYYQSKKVDSSGPWLSSTTPIYNSSYSVIEARVKYNTSNANAKYMGIRLRMDKPDSPTKFYGFFLKTASAGNPISALVITKNVTSTSGALASADVSKIVGEDAASQANWLSQWHTYKLIAQNSADNHSVTLTAFIDGIKVATFTDTNEPIIGEGACYAGLVTTGASSANALAVDYIQILYHSSVPFTPIVTGAVVGNEPGTITLLWTTVTDSSNNKATVYKIYYGTESGIYEEPIVVIPDGQADIQSYNITGLSADTKYYFAVTACNNYGESKKSEEVQVTTQPWLQVLRNTFTDDNGPLTHITKNTTIQAYLKVKNNMPESINMTYIVALYKGNELCKVVMAPTQNVNYGNVAEFTVTVQVPDVDDEYNIKQFIWQDIRTIIPLIESSSWNDLWMQNWEGVMG